MMLAESPRSLVAWLALVGCALAPCACTLQTSGLTGTDASVAGSGAGGAAGGPTGAGGAGGAGGAASAVDAASVSASAASSGSGGGSPQDPCGPGSTLGFKDDFDDDMRDTMLWNAYANQSPGIVETGQQVVVLIEGSNDGGGYRSYPTYSLLGCYVYIEVKQVVNSDDGGTGEVYFRLNGGPGQHLEFRQRGSELTLKSIINYDEQSDKISFSTSTHRWWRLRESNGKITWDTATDGQDWQTRRSLDTAMFGSVASLQLEFGATGAIQNNNDAHFDNVNVDPGGI